MEISDRVILPLVGSAFQPGKAAEAIEKIKDTNRSIKESLENKIERNSENLDLLNEGR